MKQLIVDYLPFEIQADQVNEAMKENNGKLVVKGCLLYTSPSPRD